MGVFHYIENEINKQKPPVRKRLNKSLTLKISIVIIKL